MRYDINRTDHRTLAAEKMVKEHILWIASLLSQATTSMSRIEEWPLEESASEAEASEYAQEAEVVSEPNDRLCNRCCMINIDNLTG